MTYDPAPMAVNTEIDWKTRAEDAERSAVEAWAAYHRAAADRADAAHYKHLVENYERSLSWRITAPLRLGMAIVRWVLRKARDYFDRR